MILLCGARSRWVCLERRHLPSLVSHRPEPMSEADYSFLGLVRVPPERQHKAEPPCHWFAGSGCGRLSLRLTPSEFLFLHWWQAKSVKAHPEPVAGFPGSTPLLRSPKRLALVGLFSPTLPLLLYLILSTTDLFVVSFSVFVCISCPPFTLSRLTTTLLSQLVLVPICYPPYPFPPNLEQFNRSSQ